MIVLVSFILAYLFRASIIYNAFNITDNNKVSIVPISHKNDIVKNVSIAIPFLNESMASVA